MLDNLKKYWFLYAVLSTAAIWIATINSKTFDSPEQKVTVVSAVEAMPTAAERAAERATAKANDEHAIIIRQMRYDDNKRNDSIDKIYEHKKDSLVLDQISRQTVQIEQLRQEIKRN